MTYVITKHEHNVGKSGYWIAYWMVHWLVWWKFGFGLKPVLYSNMYSNMPFISRYSLPQITFDCGFHNLMLEISFGLSSYCRCLLCFSKSGLKYEVEYWMFGFIVEGMKWKVGTNLSKLVWLVTIWDYHDGVF